MASLIRPWFPALFRSAKPGAAPACRPVGARGLAGSIVRRAFGMRRSRNAFGPGHLGRVGLGLLLLATANGVAAESPSTPRRLRVAGAQMPVSRDLDNNVSILLRAIEFAQREKAGVLVTPEGSLSGYWAGFDPQRTHRAIEQVASRAKEAGIALVLGTCFSDDNGHRYDAQRFYGADGTFLGFHSKVLLCQRVADPKSKWEGDSYKSSPLRVFQLGGLTVGGLVCNDMWANPEYTPMPDPYLARQLAGMGARVVFVSANAGQDTGPDWPMNHSFHEVNLRMRARSAGLWIVVVDAADPDGKKPSNCPSGVVNPDGQWVVKADSKGEQFFVHTIELKTAP